MSNPNSVAGAVASEINSENTVKLQAIGAGAVNQTMKAVAIANGFVAASGKRIVCQPAFGQAEINGELKTCMVLTIILL